ncbi:MAG: pyridoxine 5'-phosphate synthase [Bdellovibrionota bacterium]
MPPRLGVNIDHIATLRQLRRTPYPDILSAARLVEEAGAQQITVHLREDRRHIQDLDIKALRASLHVVLNMEMSISEEIVRFACRMVPDWACLVPEKRNEVTTEGGLDLSKNTKRIAEVISKLKKAGIKISCFIEPDEKQVKKSKEIGADAIELHTGRFSLASQRGFGTRSPAVLKSELARIKKSAELARKIGLGVHAGHGLDYDNVRILAALEYLINEYNYFRHRIFLR